jgi:hypothetical protein
MLGVLAPLLAMPVSSYAEESNPNNYSCIGSINPGAPEAGSEDHPVKYHFYCNGPITGYQIQTQIPVTQIQSPPLVTNLQGNAVNDTFSCSGELPGAAVNCVGAAKSGYETVSGQFAIGPRVCTEPRVDALLTVVYAYLEKGVITQAISGPIDLGHPKGCPADAFSRGKPTGHRKHGLKHHGSAKKAGRSRRS